MSTNTFTEKREAAKQAVADMHRQLGEQITTGSDWMAYLDFARRFHRYSPNNIGWMWAQWEQRKAFASIIRSIEVGLFGGPISEPMPELTLTAGFSKWKDMGGMVRKGEKALSVLAPFMVTDKDKIDPATGKPLKKVIGFVLKSRTFDISQVEGIEAPESPVTLLSGEGAPALWSALVRLAEAEGYTVEVAPIPGSANGFCNYLAKMIVVEASNDPAQQVKTLAHEVGHMLMHGMNKPFGMGDNVAEIEAESVAYTVLNMAGIDSAAYSFGYVGTWAKGQGDLIAATFERVADTAARIATFIEDGTLPNAKESKFYKTEQKEEVAA
jgi:hypothetical protein